METAVNTLSPGITPWFNTMPLQETWPQTKRSEAQYCNNPTCPHTEFEQVCEATSSNCLHSQE